MSRDEHHWPDGGRLADDLAAALRPGGHADAGPTGALDGATLLAGVRSRAGVIRRRRTAGASAAVVGALVALTLGVVPGVLAPRDILPAAPTGPAPTVPVPTLPTPSDEPALVEPSASVTTSVPAVETAVPLQTQPDGSLRVPDDAAPAPGAMPAGLSPIGSYDGPASAFLQNVSPGCAEQEGTMLGGGFTGSRTWTYSGPDAAADERALSADVRIDLYAPGAARAAVDLLDDRAAQCLGAPGTGITTAATEEPLRPGGPDTLVVAGSEAADPGAPEGSAPGYESVMVVTGTGDVVVRVLVTSRLREGLLTDEEVELLDDGQGPVHTVRETAEQLAAAALAAVEGSGLPARLAVAR